MRHTKNNTIRRNRGHLLIELAASLPIVICMLGLGLNGMFGIMAYLALDTACIDSARAASLAPTREIAELRAQLAVKNHNRGGIQPTSSVTHWQLNPDQTIADQLRSNPWLQVRTRVKYRLPIPMFACGEAIGLRQEMTLERSYAYPILNVERPDDAPGDGDPEPRAAAAAAAAAPRAVPIAPAMVAYIPRVPITPDEAGVP